MRPSEKRAEAQYLTKKYQRPAARISRLLGLSIGILVDQSIRGIDVIAFLDPLARGKHPKVIRVDQETEFTSRAMLDWSYKHEITLELTIVRKPNQIIESFSSRVRDEYLNEHTFFCHWRTRRK